MTEETDDLITGLRASGRIVSIGTPRITREPGLFPRYRVSWIERATEHGRFGYTRVFWGWGRTERFASSIVSLINR